jgi:hypothetical protein
MLLHNIRYTESFDLRQFLLCGVVGRLERPRLTTATMVIEKQQKSLAKTFQFETEEFRVYSDFHETAKQQNLRIKGFNACDVQCKVLSVHGNSSFPICPSAGEFESVVFYFLITEAINFYH